ncbi:MAG: tetratricopeptide repeat protein [Ornithinimicrobium sp.]
MTQQPLSAAVMRGAVDLSGLGKKGTTASAGSAGSSADGMTTATDQTFEAIVAATTSVPAVMVLWSAQVPESLQHAKDLVGLARSNGGKFQVVGVELDTNPGIMQALTPMLQQTFGQIEALPIVIGLLAGQPMPFYLGVQQVEALQPLIDKFLEAATAQGVTGRAESPAAQDDGDEEAPVALPPLHQEAVDAIDRGDLAAAAIAYEKAAKQDPADEEARLGLSQVRLMERTVAMDPVAVRRAAADAPTDVAAQIAAADLELVGGHVDDAFGRLVDLVRATAGDERKAAREHLVMLFDVIGAQDPRVTSARRALTNALF